MSKSVTPVSPELGRQDVDTVNGGSGIQEVVDEEDFDTQAVLQVIRRKTEQCVINAMNDMNIELSYR